MTDLIAKIHPKFLQITNDIIYRPSSTVYTSPVGYHTILLNTGGAITNSTDLYNDASIETLLGYELAEENGYAANAIVYGEGVWDNIQKRDEMTAVQHTITAVSTPFTVDVAIEWVDATPWRNKPVSVATDSNDQITVVEHGLTANAPVMFTGSGTVGMSKNVIYYVETVVDVNNFTLSATSGGALLDITADLVGSLTIRSAAGYPGKLLFLGTQTSTIIQITWNQNKMSVGDISGN